MKKMNSNNLTNSTDSLVNWKNTRSKALDKPKVSFNVN